MEETLLSGVNWLLAALALPAVGLPAVFLISLISATLLPLGSEPVVFGYIKLSPDMFWAAVLVATAGNTLGGLISYWMGWAAERAVHRWKEHHPHHEDDETARQAAVSGGAVSSGSPGAAPGHAGAGKHAGGKWHVWCSHWLHRLGPPALLLSWVPLVGDPLCAVAGWLKLPLKACAIYMAIGKFARYLTMTAALLWAFPS
jgi:membrane protein YqaA with SNARE-associated domain